MFHWNDTRIEGHIALCYIAYTIEDHLLQKLNISEDALKKALAQIQVSLIKQADTEFYLRSNYGFTVLNVINKLGVTKTSNLSCK